MRRFTTTQPALSPLGTDTGDRVAKQHNGALLVVLLVATIAGCGGRNDGSPNARAVDTAPRDSASFVSLTQVAPDTEATRPRGLDSTGAPDSSNVRAAPTQHAGQLDTAAEPVHAVVPKYDFGKADARFRLPKKLREISGLTTLNDSTLLAIQDEDGVMYAIDVGSGRIRDEAKFGKDGDYEGVEWAKGLAFVLRSDGTVYATTYPPKAAPRKIKSELSKRYDTEGIAYQAKRERILIVTKEYPGPKLDDARALYAITADSANGHWHMSSKPAIVLNLDQIKNAADHWKKRVKGYNGKRSFKPAGLAIHPISGEIYVVSSVWKILLVLDADGVISRVHGLTDKELRQPEGIAFLANGDLFVASEGGGGVSTLVRYNYAP